MASNFRVFGLILLTFFFSFAEGGRARADCKNQSGSLGVSRVVEIDASAGPIFGSMTRQSREPSFLKPKEVVLTFDDGPMPWVTKSILDTLDTFCTKAAFFSVGRMALSYPATVKEILARGHTLGSHTYSHPFNMPRMKPEAAKAEIELGIAAVTTAAATPISPFFRFTGLSDSSRLLAYLQTRGIATFSVDVVSNDSYIHDTAKLTERTMAEVKRQHGGIILFHDIKTTTAKALPVILARLKSEGYSVVQIRAKQSAQPLDTAMREVAPKLATAHNGEPGGKTLLPFYGAIGPDVATTTGSLDVSSVVPPLRNRDLPLAASGSNASPSAWPQANAAKTVDDVAAAMKSGVHELTGPPVLLESAGEVEASNGWVTNVKTRANNRTRKGSD